LKSAFVDKWSARRAIGKQKYVLRYGVLLIGIGLVLLFSVLDIINNGSIEYTYLIARLVFFPTIGAMYAGMRWEGKERKFAKLTNGQK